MPTTIQRRKLGQYEEGWLLCIQPCGVTFTEQHASAASWTAIFSPEALFVVVTCPVDYRPLNIRTEASICHGATPRLPRFLGRWCTDRTVCFYLLWPFFVIIHSCFKYHL